MKRRYKSQLQRNTKNPKKILGTIIHQQIQNPEEMENFLEKHSSQKLN